MTQISQTIQEKNISGEKTKRKKTRHSVSGLAGVHRTRGPNFRVHLHKKRRGHWALNEFGTICLNQPAARFGRNISALRGRLLNCGNTQYQPSYPICAAQHQPLYFRCVPRHGIFFHRVNKPPTHFLKSQYCVRHGALLMSSQERGLKKKKIRCYIRSPIA